MAHYLPPTIMNFFQPRPPLDYLPPPDMDKTPLPPITGVAAYLNRVSTLVASMPPPSAQPTKDQRKAEQRKRAEARHARHLFARRQKWNPKAVSPHHSRDAYKTLFVARLARHLTAADVQAEFEYYGPIAHCHVVHERPKAVGGGGGGEAVNAAGGAAAAAGGEQPGRSRGCAFVEFVSNSDMTEAYRDADGRKIAGRRIVVDVERGRTVKQWTPRRLGGGLGGTRLGGKDVNQTHSGREADKGREKDRDKDRDGGSRRAVSKERGAAAHGDRRDDGDRRAHDSERDREWERAERGSRDWRHADREADRERGRDRERDSYRDGYRDRERGGRGGADSRSERDRERDRGGGGGGGGDREAYWRGGGAAGGSSSGAGIGYREDRGRADRGERWERDRFRPERSNSRGR